MSSGLRWRGIKEAATGKRSEVHFSQQVSLAQLVEADSR